MFEVVNYFMAQSYSTAYAESGMAGKMPHKMCGDILNARTTAEVHTHKRTEYFTVLITDGSASQA